MLNIKMSSNKISGKNWFDSDYSKNIIVFFIRTNSLTPSSSSNVKINNSTGFNDCGTILPFCRGCIISLTFRICIYGDSVVSRDLCTRDDAWLQSRAREKGTSSFITFMENGYGNS